MAEPLSPKMNTPRPITPLIGRQMLEIVTAGMYSDPRMIYREFVQNAADSIDIAQERGLIEDDEGRITISIDGEKRIIAVEDNGTGIPADQVEGRLGSLGNSIKEGSVQRGFRGIGRLGGLAHCDLLRFETRASEKDDVAVVEWDGRALKDSVTQGTRSETLTEVVRRIAKISFREPKKGEPAHFLRATLHNVHRFHADLLMNVEAVKSYLSQEAPAPFDENAFSFGAELNSHLAALPGFRAYNVQINGALVMRPYTNIFEINESVSDRIKSVETFEFKAGDGSVMARGWFARTNLLASLPRKCSMRGIRVRQGNISIGDEYLLEDIFSERRFATWHIGSIEVSQQLRPNARRDGFEETPAFERFLEQAAMLGRHLSKQCRSQSKLRVSRSSLDRKLALAETALKVEFFVDEAHKDLTLREFRKHLTDLASIGKNGNENDDFELRLRSLNQRLEKIQGETPLLGARLDGQKLQRLNAQELLQRVCNTIMECRPSGEHNHQIMCQVVRPFLKTNS
jgi:molecular chaperone HtpG